MNSVLGIIGIDIDYDGTDGILDLPPDISVLYSCYDSYSLGTLEHEGDNGLVSRTSSTDKHSKDFLTCKNPIALILRIASGVDRKLSESDLIVA